MIKLVPLLCLLFGLVAHAEFDSPSTNEMRNVGILQQELVEIEATLKILFPLDQDCTIYLCTQARLESVQRHAKSYLKKADILADEITRLIYQCGLGLSGASETYVIDANLLGGVAGLFEMTISQAKAPMSCVMAGCVADAVEEEVLEAKDAMLGAIDTQLDALNHLLNSCL